MRRVRSRFTYVTTGLGLVLVSSALAACGGASGADSGETGVIRVGALVDVQTFDPATNPGQGQRLFLDPVYDRLLTTDADGAVQSGIATDWKLTPTSLRLTLAKGHVFSDGTPLDATAVKTGLEHNKQQAGPAAAALAGVKSISIENPTTVTLHLSEPSPSLPLDLADVAGMLVSPKAVDNPDLGTAPVGSGPYVLDAKATEKGVTYVYTPNKEYDDPKVQTLDKIEIEVLADGAARANALTTGQIDLAQVDRTQTATVEKSDLTTEQEDGNHWMLQFTDLAGTQAPALANEKIRQAVGYAIDREGIVKTVFADQGKAARQVFANGSPFYDADLDGTYPFDPDKARALVKESGVTNPSFTTPVFGPFKPIAEAIQANLKDVGIDMEIKLIQPGTLDKENRESNYPSILTPIKEIHPEQLYDARLAPQGPLNPFRHDAPEVDKLHEKALGAADDAKQAAAYQDMLTEVNKEGLWQDLFTDTYTFAWSDRVGGIELLPGWALGPSLRGVTAK